MPGWAPRAAGLQYDYATPLLARGSPAQEIKKLRTGQTGLPVNTNAHEISTVLRDTTGRMGTR
jgi:hypothetical protein